MLTQDYLHLRLIRLKATEELAVNSGQLSLVFPKGGSGKFVLGSVTHRLSPGDVLVVNATDAGRICARPGGELVFWLFSVGLENLFPLFAGNEISLLQTVSEDFKSAKLYAASQPVAVECHRLLLDAPPQVDLRHRSQLLSIVAAILSAEFELAHRPRAGFVSAEQHLAQVFESLTGAEILSLPMEALAAKFGCSRRHLNRLFHQHFGFAVAALRMEMRLLKAVSLLRNPDSKVINVAEACGFNHLGLFNTCFKRRFGVTPGQWRKRSSSPVEPPSEFTDNGTSCAMKSQGLCPWFGSVSKPGTREGAGPPQTARSGPLKTFDERERSAGVELNPLLRGLPADTLHPNLHRATV